MSYSKMTKVELIAILKRKELHTHNLNSEIRAMESEKEVDLKCDVTYMAEDIKENIKADMGAYHTIMAYTHHNIDTLRKYEERMKLLENRIGEL